MIKRLVANYESKLRRRVEETSRPDPEPRQVWGSYTPSEARRIDAARRADQRQAQPQAQSEPARYHPWSEDEGFGRQEPTPSEYAMKTKGWTQPDLTSTAWAAGEQPWPRPAAAQDIRLREGPPPWRPTLGNPPAPQPERTGRAGVRVSDDAIEHGAWPEAKRARTTWPCQMCHYRIGNDLSGDVAATCWCYRCKGDYCRQCHDECFPQREPSDWDRWS